MKVFTAFSGYDSQCMALDRLHSNFNKFNYELVGWSEIDKYAIQAHNIVYPQYKDRNYGDISKINWDNVDDFDLLTYSSPCTDFSAAGLQKGGEKGSGTRSSLLWECERAIKEKRPKYLLMENVAALVSSKFIKLFNRWQSTLEGYGYTNYAKVLNAKNYGVPQNRERIFMVSVRNDVNQKFYFPEPFKLDKRLKDILEDNVDEKYYLSERIIKGFLEHNERHIVKGTGFLFQPKNENEIACCIRSNAALAPTDNTIIEPKINIVGNVNPSGNGMNGEIFNSNGISPTITTNKGEENKILEPIIAAMRGRNPINPPEIRRGVYCEQRLEIGSNISNTLTSVQKDNLIVEPSVMQVGNLLDKEFGFKNPQRGRIYGTNGLSPALNCCQGGNLEPKIIQRSNEFYGVSVHPLSHKFEFKGESSIKEDAAPSLRSTDYKAPSCLWDNSRIRKLTPTECFRLMDVADKDIQKLLISGISNSQLYKLAGNSIVVSCLYHIFRKLFVEKQNEGIQTELF